MDFNSDPNSFGCFPNPTSTAPYDPFTTNAVQGISVNRTGFGNHFFLPAEGLIPVNAMTPASGFPVSMNGNGEGSDVNSSCYQAPLDADILDSKNGMKPGKTCGPKKTESQRASGENTGSSAGDKATRAARSDDGSTRSGSKSGSASSRGGRK